MAPTNVRTGNVKRRARVTWASVVLLAVGLIALLLIVGMTFRLASQAEAYLNESTFRQDVALAAVQLRYGVQNAESSQRGYIAGGNQVYLAPFGSGKALAYRELQRLKHLLGPDGSATPSMQRLTSIIDEKFAEMDATIALKRERKEVEAMSLFRSNRGKALMDEANVFLSKIIREADAGLIDNAVQQKEALLGLRTVTLASAGLIVLVVITILWMFTGFMRYLARARDEVVALNADLERRVQDRTWEMTNARDRAELLLAEVNHRVANSLAIVASMVGLQSRAARSEETRKALSETQNRISAVALVHQKLYTSGDVRLVALEGFLPNLLEQLEVSMRTAGHNASLKPDISPFSLPPDKSVSVGVITAEWVTNAFKYAYPDGDGEIRVSLTCADDGHAELRVEDDGVGRQDHQSPKGTGLGTKLVNAMATSLGGRIEYVARQPGTCARLILPAA